MAITYAAELITIGAAQLESWHGSASVAVLNLDGLCPQCQHPSPAEIPRQVTALENMPAGQANTLTTDLACTCQEPHKGQPDGASGCGRNWLVVTTVTSDGTVTLAPIPAASPPASTGPAPAPDPALLAAARALREATAPKQLADLRSAADKWTAGVAAIFSLFGLAGITITRNAVTGLTAGWQAGIRDHGRRRDRARRPVGLPHLPCGLRMAGDLSRLGRR